VASPFKRDTADIYDINTAVSERFVLYPPKLPGLLFHLGALFVLAALTTWGILQAARASIEPQLVVYLVLVLVGGGLAVVTGVLTLSARSSISGLLPAAPFVVLALIGGRLRRWEVWLWVVWVV